jgi:hypothetical protein
MDDLTAVPDELHELAKLPFQVSYQDRQIKKWQAIARMMDNNPDVLPFYLSTTDPERRWVFFTRASGILHQSLSREINKVGDIKDASSVAIF